MFPKENNGNVLLEHNSNQTEKSFNRISAPGKTFYFV